MKTQVKRAGTSLIIRLPSEFVKYMELSEGDWVDIGDMTKEDTLNKSQEVK